MRTFVAPLLALSLASCQTLSGGVPVVAADPGLRALLFEDLTALEGSWDSTGPTEEPVTTTFEVTSAGTVVRERMMAGTDHEMTNMYSLDGNSLVMTHYCAGGNQPRMRAHALENGEVAFRFDHVNDLKSIDEVFMGKMTLRYIDEDHIEQHWKALRRGEVDHEMVITLKRQR